MQDFISLVKEALFEQQKTTENLFRDEIISKNTFYKYKQRYPSLDTLLKIANYLKVSVDYLFELKDNNTFTKNYVYNKEIFCKNLLNFLDSKNLSGRQFCKDLNYSRDNILRWQKGVVPSVANLLEIAKYFNCLIDDLLL